MFGQASSRYEKELEKISENLKKPKTKKDYQYVLQRLGRLKEKYKQAAKTYEVTITADDKKEIAMEGAFPLCR